MRKSTKTPLFIKKVPIWGLFLLATILGIWIYKDLHQYKLLLYDDIDYVTKRNANWSLQYWTDLFTKPVANLWHPITVLSHDLCSACSNQWQRSHHAVNLFLHTANLSLIIWWLIRLGTPPHIALTAPLLWFFHPVLVESVTWVSGRKDLLVTLFSILALATAATKNYTTKTRILVCLFTIAALCSKPLAVVLPLALIFQDLVLQKKNNWDTKALYTGIKKHTELLILSTILIIITLSFQSDGGQSVIDSRSLIERSASATQTTIKSALLWIKPTNLHTAYEDPQKIKVLSALFGLLIILILIVSASWKKTPQLLRIGIILFLLFLLPTMGFIRAGNHLVADRYLYIPGLGITFILATTLSKLRPIAFSGVFVALILIAAFSTKAQRPHWKNTKTVFTRVIDIEPNHSFALAQLGSIELIEGNNILAKSYLLKSLKINPNNPIANWRLGDIAIKDKDYSTAYTHYLNLSELWGKEAWIHQTLAKLAANLNLNEEAILHASRAIQHSENETQHSELEKLLTDLKSRSH